MGRNRIHAHPLPDVPDLDGIILAACGDQVSAAKQTDCTSQTFDYHYLVPRAAGGHTCCDQNARKGDAVVMFLLEPLGIVIKS